MKHCIPWYVKLVTVVTLTLGCAYIAYNAYTSSVEAVSKARQQRIDAMSASYQK